MKFEISRRKFVYRTIQAYKKTECIEDMPKSGRPKSVTTPRVKKLMRERIPRSLSDLSGKWPLKFAFQEDRCRTLWKDNLTSVLVYQEAGVSLYGSKMKRLSFIFSDEKLFNIEKLPTNRTITFLAHNSSSILEKYLSSLGPRNLALSWFGPGSPQTRWALEFVPKGVKIT